MERHENLKDLIYQFFFKFSRFEFALKQYKYRRPGRYNNFAEADWTSFIIDFEKTYKPCDSANVLLKSPPRRQIIKKGILAWEDITFGSSDSDLKRISIYVKTIRNNLFHGGKHGAKFWDDSKRVEFLLENGSKVIDQLSSLSSDLQAHYTDTY